MHRQAVLGGCPRAGSASHGHDLRDELEAVRDAARMFTAELFYIDIIEAARGRAELVGCVDQAFESSCTLAFDAKLSSKAVVKLSLDVAGATFSTQLGVERY